MHSFMNLTNRRAISQKLLNDVQSIDSYENREVIANDKALNVVN